MKNNSPDYFIDRSTLDKLIEVANKDMDFLDRVLEHFYADGQKRLEKMESFYRDKNYKQCALEAHSLKSTSHSMGALALSNFCYGVEIATQQISQNSFAKMQDIFSSNCEELKSIRKTL